MQYDQGNPAELKEKFWKELAHSPFVMLQLDADPESAAPMTAQLDKHANHAIWFFFTRATTALPRRVQRDCHLFRQGP
jgi:hypothetical protein